MALDAGWACGKEVDDDVRLDAAGMRQSIAWELALRNVKRIEAAEAEALLRRETQCEAVRDVRVRLAATPKAGGLCTPHNQAARGLHTGKTGFAMDAFGIAPKFCSLCCFQHCLGCKACVDVWQFR